MKQLLSGQNIIKSYGVGEEKHRVLNGVSVTIGSGEFVSIMGPSGSGCPERNGRNRRRGSEF